LLLVAALSCVCIATSDVLPGNIRGIDDEVVQTITANLPIKNEDSSSNEQVDYTDCEPQGECSRCHKNDSSDACSMSGYKQLFSCKATSRDIQDGEEKVETKERYQGCIVKSPDIVKFEILMMFGASFSSYFVWQRKKQAYSRLSTIVNN